MNMNGKQTIPQTVSSAPIAVIIGLGLAVIYWLFSADESKKDPETQPTSTGTEKNGKPVVSQPISVQPESENNFPIILTDEILLPKSPSQSPSHFKRKRIRRKDMEIIFRRGELTLTEAVSALKSLGFGKSAAYEALSADGQFSAWLEFAPDGIITWKG
jgi:hypothetical protein